MNLLSLNINGLGRGDFKSDWICKLVQKHNTAILGIQETKRKDITDIMARRMWGSSDFDFEFCSSEGNSSGILCIWNNNLFAKTHSIHRKDCLIIQGTWIENSSSICLVNVYAGQTLSNRIELWKFISDSIENWNGGIAIFGDFNEVRYKTKRCGSVFDKK